MKKRVLGLIILLVVMLVGGGYALFQSQRKPEQKIGGLLGGEKIGLYENDAFQKHIKKEYGLTMDYRKAGSFAMVQGPTDGYDYLFPSSQLALELFQSQNKKFKEQDLVFNTPIVLYTRKPIVEVLKQQKIVREEEGIHYVDMKALAKFIEKDVQWKDIGLPDLYGSVLVDTTDPNESNSGNMFLGLLANSLNNGEVVTRDRVGKLLPTIKSIYRHIGHMQSSSADMFNQFMKQGLGAYPIIAGYESQILEFSKQQKENYDMIKEELVVLYPSPTVWSSHVYIALTEKGRLGLKALKDKDTQTLAWKDHGFRTIISGTADPKEFSVPGIPKEIRRVMPMPSIDVMTTLMKEIR